MGTLHRYLKDGARLAYVYHVAGLDWAATNDPDFAAYINSADPDAVDYRGKLYGVLGADASLYSCDMVQTVVALDSDLGAQTITNSRESGIDVGSWQVKLMGNAGAYQFGKLFPYTAYDEYHEGLTGLDWQPDSSLIGIAFGVMSRDLRIDRSVAAPEGVLYWNKYRDYGLKAYIEDNNSADNSPVFLWVGSSCLATNSAVTSSGDDWAVGVLAGQFNSPLEDLTYNAGIQYQITTAPCDFAGRTARLFAIPFDVVETITPDASPVGYGISYGTGYI
jgi:hypothetical protein